MSTPATPAPSERAHTEAPTMTTTLRNPDPAVDAIREVAGLFEKFEVSIGTITVATDKKDFNGEHIEREVVVCQARRIPEFYADTYEQAMRGLVERIMALPSEPPIDLGLALEGFDGPESPHV